MSRHAGSDSAEAVTRSRVELLLNDWLEDSWILEAISGDASTRRYFRVRTDKGLSWIVAAYPVDQRSEAVAFRAVHDYLASYAPLPDIVRVGDGLVIQQDLGDVSLSSLLESEPERGRRFYEQAVDLLIRLGTNTSPPPNPAFDAGKFSEELEMTLVYYVIKHCGLRDDIKERALRQIFGSLAANLGKHPYILCHRDFHGDNIFILNNHIYIIDYQDLRMGPDTYDLASLLRDRGIVERLGRDAEKALIERIGQSLTPGAEERYWESLLQRTIKTIGTFASQHVLHGRSHYLDYIPAAIVTIRDCVEHLPQYRDLLAAFPMSLPE